MSPSDQRINRMSDRVLVIDDFALARAQLRQLLTAAGFLVFEQSSATGATRTILTHKVQAVIVDVNMPGLSGDRLVSVLRKNPRLRDLVIVIVSGKSDAELQQISRAANANAVLSKSNLGELVPTLTRHLGRAETVSSSV